MYEKSWVDEFVGCIVILVRFVGEVVGRKDGVLVFDGNFDDFWLGIGKVKLVGNGICF